MNKEDKDISKTIKKIQNYSENMRETLKKIIPEIPSIKLPKFEMPNLEKIESPVVTMEKNNWERHSEIMAIQDAVLKIQERILNEQKSTSKMTFIILIITTIALIISILMFLNTIF